MPPLVAFILGYVFVVLGMRWYVERARAKRRDAFMDQLPDLARMLSNGTQAGLSIAGAVQMAARELDDPGGRRDGSGRAGDARSASRWTARSSACRSGCPRARWRC